MDDSEKLTALKRAYADIILNTAKEAAARVLASERKALRFQRELFSTKQDSLQMLLRLKHMLDSKVNEAETTLLSQQRKIEELEAQLQEAEDIVRDLRADLSEVQGELEKARNNQAQALDDPNLEGDITAHENGIPARNNKAQAWHEKNLQVDITKHESGLKSTESTFSQPNSLVEPASNSGTNSILNGAFKGSRCYSNDSHMDNCYNDNPGFASLVTRRKEPDLYKNGCTQRIRAFEGNLVDEKLTVSKLVDEAKNGTFSGRDDEGKGIYVTCTSKAENDGPQENSDKVKVSQADDSHLLDIAFNSFRKKRKRAARYKKTKAPPSTCLPHHQAMENFQDVSGRTCSVVSPETVDNKNQIVDSSKNTADEVLKDAISPQSPNLPFDGIEMSTQAGCENATGSQMEFVRPCSLQKTINDKESINKSDLMRQDSLLVGFDVPALKTYFKIGKKSEDKLDEKVSGIDDGAATPPMSNRFLKYTFRRKRKKDSLSSSEDNSLSKRKIEEKQNGSLEPQSTSLITDSSRDSRRLAQVARQLISLSEKKWL